MFKKFFHFLCLINGVSAGGDPTETKWKKQQHRSAASQPPRPTQADRPREPRPAR